MRDVSLLTRAYDSNFNLVHRRCRQDLGNRVLAGGGNLLWNL